MLGGLHIAVDHAETVGLAKRPPHLPHDANDPLFGQRAVFTHGSIERAAFHQLHGDVVDVVVATVVEDRDGVGMGQLRCGRCLQEEPSLELRIVFAIVLGAQDLDRADAAQRRLLGLVDLSHPAASNDLQYRETPVDRAAR